MAGGGERPARDTLTKKSFRCYPGSILGAEGADLAISHPAGRAGSLRKLSRKWRHVTCISRGEVQADDVIETHRSAVFLGVSLIRPSAPLWSQGGHLQQLGQPGSLTTVSGRRSVLCCEPALAVAGP